MADESTLVIRPLSDIDQLPRRFVDTKMNRFFLLDESDDRQETDY